MCCLLFPLPMGGTSSPDPMIRLFESAMLKTGAAIDKPLDGHAGWVQAVAYSTDGGVTIQAEPTNAPHAGSHEAPIIGTLATTTPALPPVGCRTILPSRSFTCTILIRLVPTRVESSYLYHTPPPSPNSQFSRERTEPVRTRLYACTLLFSSSMIVSAV